MLSSMTNPKTIHEVRFLLIRRIADVLFDELLEDEDLEGEDRAEIDDSMEELAALCLDAMGVEVVSMESDSHANAVIHLTEVELDDSGEEV